MCHIRICTETEQVFISYSTQWCLGISIYTKSSHTECKKEENKASLIFPIPFPRTKLDCHSQKENSNEEARGTERKKLEVFL